MCVYIYSIEGSARAPPFASRHRIEPIMALGSDFVVAEPGRQAKNFLAKS
jgi:hypothetical protein